MKSILTLIFMLGFVFQPSFAQTLTSVNDPIVYNGTCTNFQNNLGGSQATAIWIDDNLILQDIPSAISIVRNFEVFLGNPSESTQGLAIVLQQSDLNQIGEGGQAMGYSSSTFSPAIAFEIDTQTGLHDSLAGGADHLGVHLNGQYLQPSVAGGPVVLPDMQDGSYHQVELLINWDPANASNHFLRFTLDATYSLTYTADLASLFDLSLPIYIGGTSAPVGSLSNPVLASQGLSGDPGTCSTISLPIELLSFQGESRPTGQVKLTWETAMEENFSHFSVERALDASLWTEVGRVSGAGNSTQVQHYDFTDRLKGNGQYYYRLKQVDIDGSYAYSDVLSLWVDEAPVLMWPNPAQDLIQLDLASLSREFAQAEIQIIDMRGSVVLQKRVSIEENKEISLHALQPGIYLLKVNGNSRMLWSQRLMVK